MTTDRNGGFVAYGRWEEAHRALTQRVEAVERRMQQISEHDDAAQQARRNRIWVLVLGVMTGVVSPLIVTTILTVLHLSAH